jgi:hypothetical protein
MMITIRKGFESIFENLGLVMAPLVAAVMNGVSIWHFFAPTFGSAIAGLVGFVFAFGIEATGYMSFLAYQKDGDIKKPLWYLASVITITTTIELFVFQDPQRWGIGLSGVAIAGIMYWSHSASSSGANKLQAELQEAKTLQDSGFKRNAKGQLVELRTAPKNTPINYGNDYGNTPKNTPKRMSWKTLTPEAKQAVMELGLNGFRDKFGHVADSTFYGWLDRIEKEKEAVQ